MTQFDEAKRIRKNRKLTVLLPCRRSFVRVISLFFGGVGGKLFGESKTTVMHKRAMNICIHTHTVKLGLVRTGYRDSDSE